MKIVLPIFIFLALSLCLFNLIKINWESPLTGESIIAVIGAIASASSCLLLVILILSKKIAKKLKR